MVKMKHFVAKKPTSDEIFKQFIDASRQISEDLGINYKKVKVDRYETGAVGLSYIAIGEGKPYRFDFHLKTTTEKSNVTTGKMEASINIRYDEGSVPFRIHEDITELKTHSDFLARWTAWAVYNFNIKHNPINLDSLFNEMDILVYGIPRNTYPTMTEMQLLMGGVRTIKKGKILIYRFRHVDPTVKYRSFSYAFLVAHDDLHYFWVFFPEVGGLDSGGAGHDLQTTEELIKKIKVKTERKYFDIKYNKLEKFLSKHVIAFESRRSGELIFRLSEPSEETLGKEFAKAYSKFEQRYENEQYPQALRDLRALVQESMEIVCEKKNIDIAEIKKRDIGNLSGILVKHKIIDGKLIEWFRAFSSVANLAAHKEFPSEKDLSNYHLKERILMTLLLGTHLISEIERTITKPYKIRYVSAKNFKMKIVKSKKKGKTFHQSFAGIDKIEDS